jgi:hypothetical protein
LLLGQTPTFNKFVVPNFFKYSQAFFSFFYPTKLLPLTYIERLEAPGNKLLFDCGENSVTMINCVRQPTEIGILASAKTDTFEQGISHPPDFDGSRQKTIVGFYCLSRFVLSYCNFYSF